MKYLVPLASQFRHEQILYFNILNLATLLTAVTGAYITKIYVYFLKSAIIY